MSVGRYELLHALGKGNFAVVRLARHSVTGQRVAVKVVDLRALDQTARDKLWREVDVLKRVQRHPNVLRLFQVLVSERHALLVTEHCAGGELFDQLVARGRMSEPAARTVFAQVVGAVAFLHARGVVHRDLKAENLLLASDGRVVLADFGFSNFYKQDCLLSTWCGSPPYAAPELFEGRKYFGPKADVWSLGVVLYVLACGALPFDGNTLQSLRTRVLTGKFRIPFFMSSDCEHLLRHVLVVDPDKRYSLAQLRAHRWLKDAVVDSTALTEPDADPTLVQWTAEQLNLEPSAVLHSVTTKLYDDAFALYALVSSDAPGSAPPSPPLLPVLPSPQRKSSITTGIVERESNNTCSDRLLTPPALFLTPAEPTQHQALAVNNLLTLQGNLPMNMDLLKPPPTFLVNPNMGRRASDGQANCAVVDQPARASAQSATFTFSGVSAPSPNNSQARATRKRLSLTEPPTRREHNSRSRRRASDGAPLDGRAEVLQLQHELRLLRVSSASSPPSLQTSPVHGCGSPPSTASPPLPALPEHAVVTPPHPFRSPTPTLTVTDSDGASKRLQNHALNAHFPILPPPVDYSTDLWRWSSRQLNKTSSDNFVFEEPEARKLRLDLLQDLTELDVAVELEWIEGRRLVLRRVSGDSSAYQTMVMKMVAASAES